MVLDMNRIDLNKGWNLTYENLSWGPEMLPAVLEKTEGWMECNVPCDVHVPLIELGIIKEPVEALNSYDCEWMEQKSWWFKKIIAVERCILENDVIEIVFESLDCEADIFLNGFQLGHHKSAFYSFSMDIKKILKSGDNVLLVRVTSGLEHVSENDIAAIRKCVSTETDDKRGSRGDKRRANIRKPQYAYGWDWGPRIATCGIMKDVYLNAYKKLAVRGVHIVTNTVSDDFAALDIKVELENLHVYKSFEGSVAVEFAYNGVSVKTVTKEVHVRSGLNYVTISAEIGAPKLWWPNGMGEQNLYTVKVTATSSDAATEYPCFKYGIRTLKLNMDKLSDNERLFAIEVNGVKTFSKGGNWIPADSIYGRVTDEKYDRLIKEAKDANFTMLRVWGGGLYETNAFYEKCDEYGILVWQDFMFACAMYPDNQEWFQKEAEREMDYQTRRLRNNPCIALWSGSNENNWGFCDWWIGEKKAEFFGGAICYNKIAPALVEKNCPNIPYWNGSPYGGEEPNSNEIGDRHHWYDCTMNPDMSKRITPEEYDRVQSKFVSEYGYIGPCAKSTIVKYHGGQAIDRDADIWKQHNNTFEKDTVVAGIAKHYVDSDNMELDSYLLYAGLCQGLMYQYSLEAMKFKDDCWGSLFWMYDDCWGEVGWTIIDYYLTRKPSYYYVKRAFDPLKLILREDNGTIKVMGINETGRAVDFDMEYGYVTFNGSQRRTKTTRIELPPHSRGIIYEFEKGNYNMKDGICFVKPEHCCITPATLRSDDFRNLNVEKADIKICDIGEKAGIISFTVSSDTFAHAVHFGLDDQLHLSDEYFDLLPGESRKIEILNPCSSFNTEDIKPIGVTVK